MIELNRYEKNLIKAKAIKTVAEYIEGQIAYFDRDIKDNDADIAEYRQAISEGAAECDYNWKIESRERSNAEYLEIIRMLRIAQNAIDKEMMDW